LKNEAIESQIGRAAAQDLLKGDPVIARSVSATLAISTLALLTACVVAPREERVVYAPPPAVRPVPVLADYGRVENIGHVQIASRPSGAGAILGAVIGGVVGHQIGSGGGRALATGAGAIGGAIAGNAIENRQRRDDEVYRVVVRFDNGSARQFDFQRIDDLRVGDRVKFEGGQIHRI
jgi:outer membrane lipoprotein SlyB